MKTGAELIAEERARQVNVEGWTTKHDDQHDLGELTEAALCYGTVAGAEIRGSCAEEWPVGMFQANGCLVDWPWDEKWYKPSDDPIRNLVKAGALFAAEIDRLQRFLASKE